MFKSPFLKMQPYQCNGRKTAREDQKNHKEGSLLACHGRQSLPMPDAIVKRIHLRPRHIHGVDLHEEER